MNEIKKILIIDDDPRNIFALSAVLKAKNFECVSAQEAREGINMCINDQSIAIILMDIMMPDMDGYEAIKTIREHEALADMPVVAVTARAMPGDKEKCLEAGADAYVSKPVDVDILIDILNRHNI